MLTMGKTIKHQQLLLLDPDKAALLAELSAKTRVARQVLLREAVDDLLVKHKMLKVPKRKP
jgi:Ribbon-helix-helix domain